MATKQAPRLTDPLEGRGPGAYLRKARLDAGISIDKVASALLLHTDRVEALEADAYERLPAPTFVRGYLRGYARVLGLASGPVLEMYDRPGFEPPPLAPDVTKAAQAHTSDTAVRIVTYAVTAVLVLLVGLWWHSQENGGFGIGSDLFDRSSDAGQDPSLPAGEESETASADDKTGGALVGMAAFDPTVAPWLDGEPLGPPFATDAATDDNAATETAPDDIHPDGEFSPAMPPQATEVAPDGESGLSALLQSGTSSGDDGTPVTPPAEETATGTVATTETATEGPESVGASIALAPPQPGAPSGDDGAPVTSPVREEATGDPAVAAPVPAGAYVPEATAEREAPATQEPQPEVVAAPRTGAMQSGLVLEFVHESWVEVYDHDRTRLFFDLVEPGRTLNVNGTPPFDVLLGYGKDVRVAIDGLAFDHTPYLKHGVARFSIGEGPGDGGGRTDGTEPAPTAAPDAADPQAARDPER